jgi:integrase
MAMAERIQKLTGPRGVSYLVRVEYPRDPTTGKRKQRAKAFRTKKEAEKALAEWLTEIERGTAIDGGKMTFGEYLAHWLDTYALHNVRLSTYTAYRGYATNHIIPALGSIMLRKLTPSHLQEFYQAKLAGGRLDRKPGNLSPRTVKYFHSIIREALQHAFEQNLVARNVADATKPPKGNRLPVKVWNEEEARTFLKAAQDAPYAPLWLVLLATGMRRGEALGLRWRDVDLKKGTLSIRQTLVEVNGYVSFGQPKTKSGRRTIELDSTCIAALTAHRDAQTFRRKAVGDAWRDHDLVFTTADGNWISPRNVGREFYAIVKRTTLPRLSVHGLRHTCATLMLLHNVNPKIVSERLGHANVGITLDTYSHVLPTMQRQAATAIGEALFGIA